MANNLGEHKNSIQVTILVHLRRPRIWQFMVFSWQNFMYLRFLQQVSETLTIAMLIPFIPMRAA